MMPRAGGVYVFLREAYGPAIGFFVRLDFVSGHSNGNNRGGRNRLRKISRCLCSGSWAGELFGETDPVRRSLRDWFIY